MAVQPTYPGVYIDEFAPGAPIEGVGTSTAAFLGVTAAGDIGVPTKITSWDQFRATYGDQPVPGFPLWYAVRGFFENGGTVCYIVRVSDGTYGAIDITASGGAVVFRVRARRPGALGLQARIDPQHLLKNADTALYRATGTLAAAPLATDQEITLAVDGATPAVDVAARFRPGDTITIALLGKRYLVMRISGATIRLDQPVGPGYAAAAVVRLADVLAGQRTVRLTTTAANPLTAMVPGAMLTMTLGAVHDTRTIESVQTEFLPAGAVTYRVTFRDGIAQLFPMGGGAPTVQSEEFDLTIQQGLAISLYETLSLDASHPRFIQDVVNADEMGPVFVTVTDPPPALAAPANLPALLALTAFTTAGSAETLTGLTDAHFNAAIDALRPIDDVNLVAIPDRRTAPVQQYLITHCQEMADRFAILDARPSLPLFGATSIETQRKEVTSSRGYAALYYPWLRVRPAVSGTSILVPPSGHMAGIMARSDQQRGVHKAPANEIVNGALGVERTMSDVDQGLLNMQGINVVRSFAGGLPTLWGARTTAQDTNWQYVNIRRLFLYLEESIEEGIRWAVFEPNNLSLWQKLRRSITDFLIRAWRDGALFGATREEAFYVRIDEVLNPFSEQALGRLHIEIGVRPSYPAEFIIVRIGIWAGGKDVEEG